MIALLSWAKAVYFDLRKWQLLVNSLHVRRLDVLDDVKAHNEDATALARGSLTCLWGFRHANARHIL